MNTKSRLPCGIYEDFFPLFLGHIYNLILSKGMRITMIIYYGLFVLVLDILSVIRNVPYIEIRNILTVLDFSHPYPVFYLCITGNIEDSAPTGLRIFYEPKFFHMFSQIVFKSGRCPEGLALYV